MKRIIVVVRRTEEAGERALRWGADDLGGPGTLTNIWLSMKEKERLWGIKRAAEESVQSDLSTPDLKLARKTKKKKVSLDVSNTCMKMDAILLLNLQ